MTEAEEVFQAMKKQIAELPTLTPLKKEKELMVYLSAANEAVSAVLIVERDERQTPIHYDFYTKFYNSLGRAPNHCSSSIGKTQGVVIVHSGNKLGRLDHGLTEF
ncbi:reverse transcriptase domain-containing protein [Tanacetum coccineum]